MAIKVTVWNEYIHEKQNSVVGEIYPEGMHSVIAQKLSETGDFNIRTATLDQEQHGLTEEVLEKTDVLIWWGHMAHGKVSDEVVKRVHESVLKGMGFIALHSAHHSKIFKKLMGTTCNLRWREAGEKERIWVVEPGHPIAQGLGEYFELEHEEMYGERFDVPSPEMLVFMGWFQGGEVFRSGCCYTRGLGRIFYFQPGHESYPVFHDKNVIKVIGNSVKWACPSVRTRQFDCPNIKEPLEPLPEKED